MVSVHNTPLNDVFLTSVDSSMGKKHDGVIVQYILLMLIIVDFKVQTKYHPQFTYWELVNLPSL